MKIAIIGSNLQAGVLTALLSEYGNDVYTLAEDSDSGQEDQHQYQVLQDPHLLGLLLKLHEENAFTIAYSAHDLPVDIECYILCYEPNRLEAAKQFIRELPALGSNKPRLMINSSTFGLYGTDKLAALSPSDLWVYLPDTVQEGNAVGSFVKASKVIVGTNEMPAKIQVKELLRPIYPLDQQYLWMPILDAELAKISISGMLATRISYMNDLANVAERLGVDIVNVRQGLATDSRIGSSYLSPGVGFGGENFSHDILMLSDLVSESGVRGRLLEQVWAINEDQKEILFRKLWRHFQTNLTGKRITIWGATFKEETTSTYNSPVHKMMEALIAQGAQVQIYDPRAGNELIERYVVRFPDQVTVFEDKYEALKASDALCVLTAWKEFYSPNYKKMLDLMQTALVLDGRNIYDPAFMKSLGFIYEGVGRS